MDRNTLEDLKKAYSSAPSVNLADVIASAIVENEGFTELADFISAGAKFSSDKSYSLAEVLISKEIIDTAILVLNDQEPSHQILISRCLFLQGQEESARDLYIKTVKQNVNLEDISISSELGIDRQKEFGLEVERPKLKVIEKPDLAEVTDMARYREETTDFSDVVGLEQVKKQIHKKIILPFERPSIFERFRKKVGGGVLLYGPPGCGKTLLARATAGQCKANFFNIEISDVLDMYIGESEHKLHAIFEKARSETPAVLFFDEIEALAGKREHSRNNTSSNLVSQFLTELDGFSQNNTGVLVLASTNVPWAVDAAFLRPGRFDRMFFIPPPDQVAREAILTHHMQDRPADTGIDFSKLAALTSGYSGADLFHVVETAADEAIDESIEKDQDVVINAQHLKQAVKDSRPTTIEWLTTARNYARYANDGGRYDDVLAFLKKHGK